MTDTKDRERAMKGERDKEVARHKEIFERQGADPYKAERAATRLVDEATNLAERQRR